MLLAELRLLLRLQHPGQLRVLLRLLLQHEQLLLLPPVHLLERLLLLLHHLKPRKLGGVGGATAAPDDAARRRPAGERERVAAGGGAGHATGLCRRALGVLGSSLIQAVHPAALAQGASALHPDRLGQRNNRFILVNTVRTPARPHPGSDRVL
jgi:hypothetical protein